MTRHTDPLEILRDPIVAARATSELPVWLFDRSGTRLLFANPSGAALFGFTSSGAAAAASFEKTEIGAQIARSAESLKPDGTPRLERLRGMGIPFGQPVICTCSRVKLGSTAAVLVVATEPCGPAMTLAERASRLIDGPDAIAAFDANGHRLYATGKAAKLLNGITSLTDVRDNGETLYVGQDENAVTLLFLADETQAMPAARHQAPSREASVESTVDLAPIADAMTAMSARQRQDTPRSDGTQSRPTAPNGALPPTPDTPAGDQTTRRHPMRFAWETDAENRLMIASSEFIELAGARTASLLGRFWNEISAKLAIDPEGRIAHAMVTRDTWSGIDVSWPTGNGERIRIELCGIPAFDHEQVFCGYRGWGVWRDQPHTNFSIDKPTEQTAVEAKAAEEIATAAPADDKPATPKTTSPETASITEVPASTASENVVPFRATDPDARPVIAAPVEQSTFQELASRLTARLKGADILARGQTENSDDTRSERLVRSDAPPIFDPREQTARDLRAFNNDLALQRPILDRLPVGVLIYQLDSLLYANPAFLQLTGHASLGDFAHAGGLDSLFIEFDSDALSDADHGQSLRIAAPTNNAPTDGRLITVPFDGEHAMALVLLPATSAQPAVRTATAARETASLLDIATDGVIVVDRTGRILEVNTGAARLFGYERDELSGRAFDELFAPESQPIVKAGLERLIVNREASPLDDGREIIGRRRHGSLMTLHLLFGRADQNGVRYCVVFRDISRWKNAEKDLISARQQAEKASAAKSEFLARISHEMRTPLNAIIGFSEVMMEERFGPIGNDRYRDYLKDIRTSGSHLVSLLNDLLDLSKIEAGKMELEFERVNLNDITQQSVAIMQAQANRARIIVRTALSMNIPGIVADARSVRQILLNLLSNAIKFTSAGGQVIVSTAATDHGDVMLRVRDTGIGMSEKDIEMALQPFRQIASASRMDTSGGTGLGLPLTKALTEANRASFSIKSAVNSGTMVEIVFPAARVLAE